MLPAVAARLADPRQLTNVLVEIATAPALLWTPYPRGLTYASKTYVYRELTVSGIAQANDGAAPRVLTLLIANTDNVANPLTTDLGNRRKQVTVTKVHFDDDWQVVGAEWVFVGRISRPRIVGENLQLVCTAIVGRSGPSPRMRMRDVLATHIAPDEVKF